MNEMKKVDVHHQHGTSGVSFLIREDEPKPGLIEFASWYFDDERNYEHSWQSAYMKVGDYSRGVRELAEKGKCSIPFAGRKKSEELRDIPSTSSLEMELKKGKVIVKLGKDEDLHTEWSIDQIYMNPPRNSSIEEFLLKLLKRLGFDEDYYRSWVEKNLDTICLMPDNFSIKKGFTAMGVLINDDWALKFDLAHRIEKEYGFYGLNHGKFREFVPRVMDIDDPYTDDRQYGVLVLENVFRRLETGFMKAKKFGFERKIPKIPSADLEFMTDYILFAAGIMHSELTKNNDFDKIPEKEFKDLLGMPCYLGAENPLKNYGMSNLHFFRDTVPNPESQRMIEDYNAWRRDNPKCIIHGDVKLANIGEGYFFDPSQWGKGNELDDLAFFLSDIRLYKGIEWFKKKVRKYAYYRSQQDRGFYAELTAGRRKYLFDDRIVTGALQQQLAIRNAVMNKRIIGLHKVERVGYHFLLEDMAAWMLNPKAHGYSR